MCFGFPSTLHETLDSDENLSVPRALFFFFYLSETRAGLPVEWSSHVMNALFLSLSLWQEKPA